MQVAVQLENIADLQAVFRSLSNRLSATSSVSDSTLQKFMSKILPNTRSQQLQPHSEALRFILGSPGLLCSLILSGISRSGSLSLELWLSCLHATRSVIKACTSCGKAGRVTAVWRTQVSGTRHRGALRSGSKVIQTFHGRELRSKCSPDTQQGSHVLTVLRLLI